MTTKKQVKWIKGKIKNGIGQVTLTKWKYFMEYIYDEMLDFETYIWRGQECDDWMLQSTLDRLEEKLKISGSRRELHRKEHLEKFKFAVCGRRGVNPIILNDDNEWWALGQHNGLATPLLDWTYSPFVSAFFAFMNTNERSKKYGVVYALHKPSIEEKSAEIYKQLMEQHEKIIKKGGVASLLSSAPSRKPIEFVRPFSDENHRLLNQNALFTRAPNGVILEEWITKNFVDEKGYILIKIRIPNIEREVCLRTLNRMNINHLTLFPDLFGSSHYCNTHFEITKY